MNPTQPNEAMNHETKIIYNRFFDFFAEAVYFADIASEEILPVEIRPSLVKSSILNCVFAMESLANALTQPLNFSRKAKSGFDNLPILGKLQTFYLSRTGRVDFDRSCREVQAIEDLIEFRNDQAHSKLREHVLEDTPDGGVIYPDIPCTNHLKLPLFPYFLKPDHGISTLKAVDEFLELYFLRWCGMTDLESSQYLFNTWAIGENRRFTMSTPVAAFVEDRIDKIGLKLRFVHRRIFKISIGHK